MVSSHRRAVEGIMEMKTKTKPKGKTISDLLGRDMGLTEYYRCKFCRSKVFHVFRGQHLLTHMDKIGPDIYTPIKK